MYILHTYYMYMYTFMYKSTTGVQVHVYMYDSYVYHMSYMTCHCPFDLHVLCKNCVLCSTCGTCTCYQFKVNKVVISNLHL